MKNKTNRVLHKIILFFLSKTEYGNILETLDIVVQYNY